MAKEGNPQAGLFKDLFNKSGDELKKIEESDRAPKAPIEDVPPVESEEDREIRERIKQFRKKEGRDPDTGKIAGLLKSDEFDEYALSDDPMLHPLQGEDEATPQEEAQLDSVIQGSADFVFGDGLPAVVQNLKKGGELYQPVSNTVYQILLKQKQELEKSGTPAEASVFFAETGAIPVVTDMVWDLAVQLGLPGSNDQDQYAAATINVMRLAGEHILESKDQAAIDEATRVASNMVEVGMGGEAAPAAPKRKALNEGIDEALLGGIA